MHQKVTFIFIISLCLISICVLMFECSIWLLIGIVILYVLIVNLGVWNIQMNYFLKAISFVNTSENILAITFDDGPTNYTPQILEILDKYQAKATFFCIGKQIEKHPDIFKKIIASGHQIGNHTYLHSKNFGFYNQQKVRKEILQTDQLIKQFTNDTILFRPPFGVTNPHITSALSTTKHRVIGWNIRSLDTVITDENKILNRILPKIQKGCIILLHDTSVHTSNVLEQLLLHLNQKKMKSVTIDKLLEYENK